MLMVHLGLLLRVVAKARSRCSFFIVEWLWLWFDKFKLCFVVNGRTRRDIWLDSSLFSYACLLFSLLSFPFFMFISLFKSLLSSNWEYGSVWMFWMILLGVLIDFWFDCLVLHGAMCVNKASMANPETCGKILLNESGFIIWFFHVKSFSLVC